MEPDVYQELFEEVLIGVSLGSFRGIEDERIKNYLQTLEDLKSWPESIRLFNETFHSGADLVREFGRRTSNLGYFLGCNNRLLACSDSSGGNKLVIDHLKSFKSDSLIVIVLGSENEIFQAKDSFVLLKKARRYFGILSGYKPNGLLIKSKRIDARAY
jgi:hypothetical protein